MPCNVLLDINVSLFIVPIVIAPVSSIPHLAPPSPPRNSLFSHWKHLLFLQMCYIIAQYGRHGTKPSIRCSGTFQITHKPWCVPVTVPAARKVTSQLHWAQVWVIHDVSQLNSCSSQKPISSIRQLSRHALALTLPLISSRVKRRIENNAIWCQEHPIGFHVIGHPLFRSNGKDHTSNKFPPNFCKCILFSRLRSNGKKYISKARNHTAAFPEWIFYNP